MTSLAVAFLSYALILVVCWGIGDRIYAWLGIAFSSRLAAPILSLAIGMGVIGETVFLAGLIAPVYRAVFFWTAFGALAVVIVVGAIRRRSVGQTLLSVHEDRIAAHPIATLAWFEWTTLGLIAFYAVRLFRILCGFSTGSDVLSHHYSHVKHMLQVHRFARQQLIPLGLDNVSNYNPGLMRVLFVPGHAMADERVSNLLHWTIVLMLLGAVYLLGRELASRAAGLLAVAIVLTAGNIANFSAQVSDYPLAGVFFLLAVLAAFHTRSHPRAWWAAGLLGGFGMCTKYYGGVFFPLILLLMIVVSQGPWTARLTAALKASVVAGLLFLPWALYNFVTVGNPVYPMMSRDLMPSIYAATNPMHILQGFLAPGDRSTAIPRFFEYVSLFIPFEPSMTTFCLGVVVLIGLPISVAYLGRWRPRTASANLLFILSVVMFAAVYVAIARLAYYKWALFPLLPYAVSLGILATNWRRVTLHVFAALVFLVAIANYRWIVAPFYEVIGPGRATQRERWDSAAGYLNERLPQGAVIAGLNFRPNYYLRRDIRGIEEQEGFGTDWAAEERRIREERVEYYAADPLEQKKTHDWYAELVRRWRRLAPQEESTIAFLEDFDRRVAARTELKTRFLSRYPATPLPDGWMLYKLR